MALKNTNKVFRNDGRDIKYLNKDFQQFRTNLIEFSKTYFPKTFSDFNEASPGMLFIEMASYVGDVLSYYIDDTLKESLMVHAEDLGNVLSLSQYLGYRPKVTSPSVVTISVYQLVPSIGSGTNNRPDDRFYLTIKDGMGVRSTSTNVQFLTTDVVDFNEEFGREITVYSRDNITGDPTFYLVKKQTNAISAEVRQDEFSFGSFQSFPTIDLQSTNIIEIFDVRDGNGNKYYEVPYLAQETIYIGEANTEINNPQFSEFRDGTPSRLRLLSTPRRFVTRVNEDSTTTLTFGAGGSSQNEELLIPNLKNVGLGLPNSINRLGESFDPTNFLKTNTYGVAPSNTTVTVRYLIGGGVESNVPVNDLTTIVDIEFDNDPSSFSPSDRLIYNRIISSVAVDNEIPASGGRDGETIEEIRQNALANFGSQNRAVTDKDYVVRSLSMPVKFGSVSKAFAISDGTLDNNTPSSILSSPNALQQFTDLVLDFTNSEDELSEEIIKESIKDFLVGKESNTKEKNNPFAVNLYVLGYDQQKKLTSLNRVIKENLKTYLNEHRMLTDGVNILDGFVINLGIDFDIKVYTNYNKTEVLLNCISQLKDYFEIDNWTFNQPINISEIELLVANVEGVQSVQKMEFYNKFGGEYSPNRYNVDEAIQGKILYPSLYPSVFEIKFPDKDIRGRVV
jgi:hypothetical protein